jgi:hypothetical protein
MAKPLSKSRFTQGLSCPTKLYYGAHSEYVNKNSDDEFLRALAEGGFQVGELAKLYYPGGVQVSTLDYDEAVRQTDELLKQANVVIYEAAFRFKNLFVRADIVVKQGNQIELTEVKAKSFDSTEDFEPFNKPALKRGVHKLKSGWDKYLLDLAFQTYVLGLAKPEYQISAGLMLADTSKVATVDGLNQLFLIGRDSRGRTKVEISASSTGPALGSKGLGSRVLSRLDLTSTMQTIIDRAEIDWADGFKDLVDKLSALMESGEKFTPTVGAHCKGCEFRSSHGRSGFSECWAEAKQIKDSSKEFVFDVWQFRNAEDAIQSGKIFARDLSEDDVSGAESSQGGLSRTERQLLQIEFAKGQRTGFYIDRDGLASELKMLPPPFHFIDFETTMVAIPFHKGRRPYEQMAFQFSHHIVERDGRIEHKNEYLDDRRGKFPNFDFVRELRISLGSAGGPDAGTVFRFAAHENTVLNQIREQLLISQEPDRHDLVAWIEELTTPSKTEENPWKPKRAFVDMCELTKRYYYLPETRGSNSIKRILPAVLSHAGRELRPKFPEQIRFDEAARVMDPYKNLPPIFSDVDAAELENLNQRLVDRDDLSDGGAAMVAWARMQFSEMGAPERRALREALLRYCGLDTLAMVIIWEWWQLELARGQNAA